MNCQDRQSMVYTGIDVLLRPAGTIPAQRGRPAGGGAMLRLLPIDIVTLENVYISAMLRLVPMDIVILENVYISKTIVEGQARLMRTASSICQGLQMIWRSPARARQ